MVVPVERVGWNRERERLEEKKRGREKGKMWIVLVIAAMHIIIN